MHCNANIYKYVYKIHIYNYNTHTHTPDVAPDDGVQPEPQFDPPHVRFATATAGALCLPGWQWSQSVLTPADALCLPASQFAQTVDAITAEYLPAAQSSHSMLTPVLTPALDLNFPAGHMLQASLLRTALNLPDSHTSHAPEVVTHPATPAALAASGSPLSQTHGAP